MMDEIWKDIKGYEGLYQISSFGNVRGLDRVIICKNGTPRHIKGRAIKPKMLEYKAVSLCKNGHKTLYNIHRLVAEAFIPNPNNLPCVNHKDENKYNNNIVNLEWCDDAYNNTYGTKPERLSKKKQKTCEIYQNGEFLGIITGIGEIAKVLGVNPTTVGMWLNGRCKSKDGYEIKEHTK